MRNEERIQEERTKALAAIAATGFASTQDIGKALSMTADAIGGGIGAGLFGIGIGATVGTFIPIPGVGTVIGAVVGAIAGVFSDLADTARDCYHGKPEHGHAILRWIRAEHGDMADQSKAAAEFASIIQASIGDADSDLTGLASLVGGGKLSAAGRSAACANWTSGQIARAKANVLNPDWWMERIHLSKKGDDWIIIPRIVRYTDGTIGPDEGNSVIARFISKGHDANGRAIPSDRAASLFSEQWKKDFKKDPNSAGGPNTVYEIAKALAADSVWLPRHWEGDTLRLHDNGIISVVGKDGKSRVSGYESHEEMYPLEAIEGEAYDILLDISGRGDGCKHDFFCEKIVCDSAARLIRPLDDDDEEEKEPEIDALARHLPGARIVVACYSGRRAFEVAKYARSIGLEARWWSVAHSPFEV